MQHSLILSLNKGFGSFALRQAQGRLCLVFAILVSFALGGPAHAMDEDPVTLKVVAVNPSEDKTQQIPVRIDLPQEITPKDVLDVGEMKLEYDDERKVYFVSKEAIQLAPKETKVFEVRVRDVWFISKVQLDSLRSQADSLAKRLEKTEHAAIAQEIVGSVQTRLEDIATVQGDETLSRKSKIGAYRLNLQTIAQIKEDLSRLEKMLTTIGSKVPEALKSLPQSEAPSTQTMWMTIFIILIFLGALGGLFFITWNQRAASSKDMSNVKQLVYPDAGQKPAGPADSSKEQKKAA